VRLGNSGLKVSKIILGCMTYGSLTWSTWALSEEEGIKHIKAVYDTGINTFDTTNIYSNGLSEVILGNAIKKLKLPREEIVVMTKVCKPLLSETIMLQPTTDKCQILVNSSQGSLIHIFATVKASLEHLQLDYIDVLQYHRIDPNTPLQETIRGSISLLNLPSLMQALHDVIQAGYVCYIGMSSCRTWQFHIMQNYSITNKLTPFISNHYNMVYREEEREMVPSLKHFGVGSVPWSPLARGMLTHPSSEQTPRSGTDSMVKGYEHDSSHQIIERVEEIVKKKGVTMAQVALAWLWTRESVAAPIVRTTSVKNLFDLIDALDLKLSEEEVQYLDEPYQALPIFSFY
ncbi:NADP-dependent oxidoreductase domain-containing protein, partial [Lentinula aff. lateritia]